MQIKSRIPALPNKSLLVVSFWVSNMHIVGLLYQPNEPVEVILNIAGTLP